MAHGVDVTVKVWNQLFREITNVSSHFVKLLFHSGVSLNYLGISCNY